MNLTQIVKDSFDTYRTLNEAHPLLGSMATAAVIYPTADIVSQYISDRHINWKKVVYSAALSPLYGMAIYGCVRTGDIVGEYISSNPFVRGALGPNLWGNIFNVFFFTNNTVGERSNYSLGKLAEHYKKTCFGARSLYTRIKESINSCVPRQEYINALIGTVTFWNAFQAVNYSYVPEKLQTSSTLGVALLWTIGLSFWALRGGRKLTAAEISPQVE